MRSGSVADQPLIELLGSLAAQRASGRLEVLDGKRKRQLWFEGGKLNAHKSNLRSESAERISERQPDLSPEQVATKQGRKRVLGVLSQTTGEWTFTPNEVPKRRAAVDLPAVAWEALNGSLDGTLAERQLAGLGARFPTLRQQGVSLDELPLVGNALGLIEDLDGQRPLDDVLEFCPVVPDEARKILYLAMCFGLVEFGAAEGLFAKVEGAADADDDPFGDEFAPPDVELDFDDLDDPTDHGHSVQAPPARDHDLLELRQTLARLQDAEDHFAVLAVRWDDDFGTMRQAYFALAQRLHPDRWNDASAEKQELVVAIFARVTEAWNVLGDDDARKAYTDRIVHGVKSEDELAMEKVRAILEAEDTFKQGLMRFNRGDMVAAHELFKEAHEQVPEEFEFQAYFGYTTFRLNWNGDKQLAQRGVQLIKDATDQATKLDSGWVLMGMVWREVGQPAKAIAAFKKALELNPGSSDAERELRRAAHERRKQLDEEKKAEAKKKGLFGRLFGGKK
jgi:curved DNA-binding protein CbpA